MNINVWSVAVLALVCVVTQPSLAGRLIDWLRFIGQDFPEEPSHDENPIFLADSSAKRVTNECIRQGKANKCCPDGKIAKDEEIHNCAKRLCYDMPSGTCKKAKKAGKLSKDACKYSPAYKYCYYSCNTCDEKGRATPKEKCEETHQKCCWDGNVASWDGACAACVERPITCRRFLRDNDNTCETNSYYKRKSFFKLCPKSCGLCR